MLATSPARPAAIRRGSRCTCSISRGSSNVRRGKWGQRSRVQVPDLTLADSKNMAADGSGKTITIAIEGCCHGELDNIYGALQQLEQVEGKKIDLLISCGDFQAVRNMDDLETMACPPKYRDIQSFYKYYSGASKPPFPTLFVGGNHEAANHLWELYYGGWAAPDIMFLGFTGCIKFGGLRIAGLSGIYKQGDYRKGHYERLPYDDSSMRSIYHIRDFEVYRLMQIQQPVDVFLSHDWPTNIVHHGDKDALLRRKPFFAKEIAAGELGSPAGEQLLHALRPAYWFSAHLHTKFPAVVRHLDGSTTRFLALDKCLPGRDFLQVVELPARGPLRFEYDPEWLAILRTTHSLMNLNRPHRPLPGMGGLRAGPSSADVQHVEQLLASRGGAEVPLNFSPTAAAYNPQQGRQRGRMPTQHVRNPQTVAFLELLGLPYNLDHAAAPATAWGAPAPGRSGLGLPPPPAAAANPEEINLDDLDDEAVPDQGGGQGVSQASGDAAAPGPGAADAVSAPGPAPRRGKLSLPQPQHQQQPQQPQQGAGAVANPEEITLDAGAGEGPLGVVDDDAPPTDDEQEGQGGEPQGTDGGGAALAADPMFQPINL